VASKDTERLKLIQKTLREKDWDALVLFHPDNIAMSTGMLPGSTHVLSIVTADGRVAVITPWWREVFVRQESWADEVRTFDWCRGFSEVDPLSALVDGLKKSRKALAIEKVGYDARMHHYSSAKLPSEAFTYDEVKSKLSDVFRTAEDATPEISRLKSIKTPREIQKLRTTHQVAKAAILTFYANAKEGIREVDLAAEVNSTILKMVGEHGIRYTYCDPPQITSGPERTAIADTMSNHATEKLLKQGDLVMLELGIQADGYWADITRTVVVGEPTERQWRMHGAILAAQASAIAAYRPGRSTGDELCRVAWRTIQECGFEKGTNLFLGHGVGFAYHEDCPILGPGGMEVIQPGHVTSVEPGLYFTETGPHLGGMRVEDNVVWGNAPGEAEMLSDFQRGLR
jgi:Xaa-Pro aminopeptidase